jgi:spermidine/putrescine transport system ATP-binding protein
MGDGRVEQIGSPEEIYDTPATIFVAGFIGSANLLPGTIAGEDGANVMVKLDSGPLVSCRRSGDAVGVASGPATVMVRPERLTLGSGDSAGQGIPATVTDLIFQGATQRVIMRTDDGADIVAHLESGDHSSGRPGDRLWLTWRPGSAFALRGAPMRAGATTTDVDQVEASL